MYAKCEGDGTLHLDDDLRSRFGEIFLVVETEQGFPLIPAEGHPVIDGKRLAIILNDLNDSCIPGQASLVKRPGMSA